MKQTMKTREKTQISTLSGKEGDIINTTYQNKNERDRKSNSSISIKEVEFLIKITYKVNSTLMLFH